MMTKEKLQNKITELKSINNKSSWELGQLNVLEAWLSNMEKQEKIIDKVINTFCMTVNANILREQFSQSQLYDEYEEIRKELKFKLFVGK